MDVGRGFTKTSGEGLRGVWVESQEIGPGRVMVEVRKWHEENKYVKFKGGVNRVELE